MRTPFLCLLLLGTAVTAVPSFAQEVGDTLVVITEEMAELQVDGETVQTVPIG